MHRRALSRGKQRVAKRTAREKKGGKERERGASFAIQRNRVSRGRDLVCASGKGARAAIISRNSVENTPLAREGLKDREQRHALRAAEPSSLADRRQTSVHLLSSPPLLRWPIRLGNYIRFNYVCFTGPRARSSVGEKPPPRLPPKGDRWESRAASPVATFLFLFYEPPCLQCSRGVLESIVVSRPSYAELEDRAKTFSKVLASRSDWRNYT